ncbi:MAG: aminoglycoside phosphotransferase family protein [Candidatus Dormibacteraeota bacterium]|nr:aminoglycoside phosphotransferase family protein [Candidatus Dormibacteraeota bacterium]
MNSRRGNFGGFTPASRRLVTLPDGRSAFAKGATTDLTEAWLRAEHHVYTHLRGSFMPLLLGWDDSGERPVMLLEDLTGARWPPPWEAGDEALVLAALEEIHAATPPPGLPGWEAEFRSGWPAIVRDRGPFLSLGLVTEDWLEANLLAFQAASERARLAGESLVHFDIRSDNLCFRDGRAVIVDWNWASLGDPAFDAQFWLPSLVLEGGSPPIELAPEYAAWMVGFFGARAGLPGFPDAPGVRPIQLAQLKVVLPWACRLLDIPLPDG